MSEFQIPIFDDDDASLDSWSKPVLGTADPLSEAEIAELMPKVQQLSRMLDDLPDEVRGVEIDPVLFWEDPRAVAELFASKTLAVKRGYAPEDIQLATPTVLSLTQPEDEEQDYKKAELTAITKAKDLCHVVLEVTDKSPKRYRFTLVSRMQNLSLEIIEKLYRANEVYVRDQTSFERRLTLQHEAITAVKLLGYMSLIAREQQAILPKQYERVSKLVSDCQNLTGAWINADRKRWEQ